MKGMLQGGYVNMLCLSGPCKVSGLLVMDSQNHCSQQ